MNDARRRRSIAFRLVIGAAVVFGVVLRLWVLVGNHNPTESDEAVLGLIAIHATDGDLTLMYWGQTYGGPVEAYVCALLFLVTGPSVFVSKLTGALLAGAASVLTWRVGRRAAGPRAGAVAGALMWIAPTFFVWYSTKISIYFGSLALATATLLCITQIRDDEMTRRRWWPPVFGLLAGLSFWASAQAVFLLLPAAIVFAVDAIRRWPRMLIAVPFVVVGAAPWILFNLRHDWASFEVPPSDVAAPYSTRLLGFFPLLPMLLGLRHVGTERWVGPPALGVAAAAAVVVMVVAAIVLRVRWWRLAAIAAGVPLAYALSPLSVRVLGGQPRYLLMLMPPLSVVVAAWCTGRRPGLRSIVASGAVVACAAALTTIGFREFERIGYGRFPGSPDGFVVPDDFDPLLAMLDEHDVEHAYADYWISFRATFEAHEETIVAPIQAHLDRYPPYTREVERADAPAFVALDGSRVVAALQARLDELGVTYDVDRRAEFVLVMPRSDVGRDEVAGAYY